MTYLEYIEVDGIECHRFLPSEENPYYGERSVFSRHMFDIINDVCNCTEQIPTCRPQGQRCDYFQTYHEHYKSPKASTWTEIMNIPDSLLLDEIQLRQVI